MVNKKKGNKRMNKPLTMIIKETEAKIIKDCNESGLHPAILDLVVQRIYHQIHSLAERQAVEEELSYAKIIKDKDIKNNNSISEADTNEVEK